MLRAQYQRIRCSSSRPSAPPSRRRHPLRRSHRLPVVATSEFWWEDEQEFDALTEVLQPKQVYLTTPTAAAKHLQLLKDTTKFAAAFTTPKLKTIAEQLWQQLGRAGPPMFLKVRTRDALQQVDQDPTKSDTAAAAEQFWQEIASQTWRTELDHGLTGAEATAAAATEQILIIVGSTYSLHQLSTAAGDELDDGDLDDSDSIAVVQLAGWNQGATQQQLTSWRGQLKPKLQQLAQLQQ